jgi:hypothetical protein
MKMGMSNGYNKCFMLVTPGLIGLHQDKAIRILGIILSISQSNRGWTTFMGDFTKITSNKTLLQIQVNILRIPSSGI